MINEAEKPRGMPGREVLQRAIEIYERRSAVARAQIENAIATYGAENVSEDWRRNMELDSGIVVALTLLLGLGSGKLEDMTKDKTGKPFFADKVRWETNQKLVQGFAGCLRGAFSKFPPDAERVVEQPQEAAHAA